MNSISEFFELSDVDKIAVQLTAVLRSDDRLMSWTNENIERTSLLSSLPDRPPPQIIVSAQTEEELFEPSGKSTVTLPVGILILWEENLNVLEELSPSMVSIVQYIKGLLISNYYLNCPQLDERIVRRMQEFQTVDYGGIEMDGETIKYIVLKVNYLANISVMERKRVCYS